MEYVQKSLVERFDANRARLVTLASRVLDSRADAEEVVQDAWLHLVTVDAEKISNLSAWLSTVVARAAIDRLRQRRSRSEIPLNDGIGSEADVPDPEKGPEAQIIFADAISSALVVVLDRLAPAERLAFVLHDLFGLSFDEIATVVGRSPAAARQLASRARRRVRVDPERASEGLKARADVIAAFAKASQEGRMEDLLRILDPEVTLTLDQTGLPIGMSSVVCGAPKIASRAILGAGSEIAELMLVNGEPGLVTANDGSVERILMFAITAGLISAIEVVTDPARIAQFEFQLESSS